METNLWGDALRASRLRSKSVGLRHRYSRFLTIQADKTEISTCSQLVGCDFFFTSTAQAPLKTALQA